MVVPLFGWSAGDLVVSIKILYHIGEAFREAGGAKDQYAETASWLDSFAHDLEQIREYVANTPTAKYTDSSRSRLRTSIHTMFTFRSTFRSTTPL